MTQKEIAIQCLERLDIYKPYIRKFKSKAGIPCFFERFGGFYSDQEPKLWEKIKEVEKEYNILVYAITHEFTELGETWSMLCIPQNLDSVEDCLSSCGNGQYYAYAFVWNETDPICSEFGDVVVKSAFGGLCRIG